MSNLICYCSIATVTRLVHWLPAPHTVLCVEAPCLRDQLIADFTALCPDPVRQRRSARCMLPRAREQRRPLGQTGQNLRASGRAPPLLCQRLGFYTTSALLSWIRTFPQPFPRQLSQLPAGLSKATLAATRPRQCFKPFRRPFQGNSRSYRPQPSVFKHVQDCRLPALKTFKPFRRPPQGNSRSFPQAFPRQLSQLHAPDNASNPSANAPDNASNPSAGLSKATLAATRPSHLFLSTFKTAVCPPSNPSNPSAGLSKAPLAASRRPFQGNSRSYRPQTMLQTLPRPFQGNSRSYTPQPSVFKRRKPFARLQAPQTPQTLPQAFPRQLLQLPAGLSKATLAATHPRQCFKPSRKPFQGNSRSYRPQPSVFMGVQDCRFPAFKPLKRFRRPFQGNSRSFPQAFPRQLLQLPAGLSKATLAATRPRQCFKPFCRPFQGNSRSYTPQPSAFKRFKTAVCPPSNPSNPSAGLSKATLAPSRKPFQGNSRSSHSYTPQTMFQTLPQAFPRQLSQLQAPAICFKGVQDCRLPAFKPLKPFRKPFQGNSRSFPQAFPRQLSQLHAPDNASNPSASLSKATLATTRPSHLFLRDSRLPFARLQTPQTPQTLPQAFPRHLLQLPAGLSKATLAATRPRQCFKPFRRPFQGNSRSYTPQPSVFKRFKTVVCPPSNPSNPSNPSAGLSKATIAPSRRRFQRNSRSHTPQTMLQTLPQAFPRQLSQLHAPAICF